VAVPGEGHEDVGDGEQGDGSHRERNPFFFEAGDLVIGSSGDSKRLL
jgi:hypothetical protein